MSKSLEKPLTYKEAGVNITAGNQFVDALKTIVRKTHRPEVLGGLGSFGGCFDLSRLTYREPVLVATTDGVGTKLRFAIQLNQHRTIGQDLVAMCVNDLVVMGAEPLFFLDYFATSKLSVLHAQSVVEGIAEACQAVRMALIGGETAEMPGFYAPSDYDLAGFAVGVVEKAVLKRELPSPGDLLIALASHGLHSNGYSFVRHLLDISETPLTHPIAGKPLSEHLLMPTRLYVSSMLPLMQSDLIKGAAHITGGGLWENIPRILPQNTAAYLECDSWQLSPLFQWIQTAGSVSTHELRRTFNCGIGMVLCVSPKNQEIVMTQLAERGESAWCLGHIVAHPSKQPTVIYSDAS